MKKFLIVMAVCFLTVSVVHAAQTEKEAPATLSSGAYLVGGSQYFLRGVAGVIDFRYTIAELITPGVEVILEYDSPFQCTNIPVLFTLGFGKDFWLSAGYSFQLPHAMAGQQNWGSGLSPAPDTFGVGFSGLLASPNSDVSIKLVSELTFTDFVPETEGVGQEWYTNQGLLSKLRWYVGAKVVMGLR